MRARLALALAAVGSPESVTSTEMSSVPGVDVLPDRRPPGDRSTPDGRVPVVKRQE
jgi:hypothetical protein